LAILLASDQEKVPHKQAFHRPLALTLLPDAYKALGKRSVNVQVDSATITDEPIKTISVLWRKRELCLI
jgi:hypothetical protein